MFTVLETPRVRILEENSEMVKVNQYTLHEKLGEGAYGVVVECENEYHQKFALKCVSKSLLKRQKEFTKVGRRMTVTTAFDDVIREIALMKKLSHPKIVQLFEVMDDPENDKLFMLMELVNGGEVMNWDKTITRYKSNPRLIKENGSGFEMSEDKAILVMRDILIGLDYLHRSHVVHRDLKPQNLLLTKTEKVCVKIADFGISFMFEDLDINDKNKEEKLTRMKGTYPFYAPECMEGTSFDGYRADIWALGITLYCFLTGRLPFYSDIPPDLFEMIEKQPIDFDKLNGYSKEAIEFTKILLEKDPTKRPANARAVIDLQHPWLGGPILEEEEEETEDHDITDHEVSLAVTRTSLNLHTVASLKVMVHRWRERAAAAAKLKEEGLYTHQTMDTTIPLSTVMSTTTSVSSFQMDDLLLTLPPTSPLRQNSLDDISSLASKSLISGIDSTKIGELTKEESVTVEKCCSLL